MTVAGARSLSPELFGRQKGPKQHDLSARLSTVVTVGPVGLGLAARAVCPCW